MNDEKQNLMDSLMDSLTGPNNTFSADPLSVVSAGPMADEIIKLNKEITALKTRGSNDCVVSATIFEAQSDSIITLKAEVSRQGREIRALRKSFSVRVDGISNRISALETDTDNQITKLQKADVRNNQRALELIKRLEDLENEDAPQDDNLAATITAIGLLPMTAERMQAVIEKVIEGTR